MYSKTPMIAVEDLGKCYRIYNDPRDRFLHPLKARVAKLLGKPAPTGFREFWALRHLNLAVYPGETVGIIGRNGSGKSTLLQMICGTLANTEGRILVRGRIAALLELGAGFNPEFTGRENIYLNAAVLGLTPPEIAEKFASIVNFADIGEFIGQPVKHYSSGMYARLAFAVAISVDPKILIVDEALAVGDEAFQRKCYARIEEIKNQGGTILLVSHSATTVTNLCDRAVLLHRGVHVYTGSSKIAVALYQKLMNSDSPVLTLIEKDLRLIDAAEDSGADVDSLLEHMQEKNSPDTKQAPGIFVDGYDPDLQSKSMVAYAENGASIDHVEITNEGGMSVNRLLAGQFYTLSYNVRFLEDVPAARFRCMLKTVAGIELGGGTYPSIRQTGLPVKSGDGFRMKFRFQANLAEGMYFANCGVSDGITSLHRIIDALAFRVIQPKDVHHIGTVDFCFKSECAKNDETA